MASKWKFSTKQRPWETRKEWLESWTCEVTLGEDYACGFGPGFNPRWRRRRMDPEVLAAILRTPAKPIKEWWIESKDKHQI